MAGESGVDAGNLDPEHDPYLWLEEVTGDRAMQWVRAQNDRTCTELTATAEFTSLQADLLEVLDTDARIPYVRRRGTYLYNFWRDGDHVRGIWRRTTLESYRTETPVWDVLIDLDALADREGENWVWKGANVLRPGYELALVTLSRGGADAAVVREFDLRTREFIGVDRGGFALPEAKSDVGWIDSDTIYVGTDFGPGSLTDSGYPRVIRCWSRGTDLAEAPTVFECKPEDVAASGWFDPTPGFERSFVERAVDFYNAQRWLLTDDGDRVRIDTPEDAEISVRKQWLLVFTRSPWTVAGTEHPPGTLLAADFEEYLAGARDLTVVFAPDEHTSLETYAWTADHLVLVTLHDVQTGLRIVNPGTWTTRPFEGLPRAATIEITGTDPDRSNELFLSASGFTQPSTLLRGCIDADDLAEQPQPIKRAPAFFDAADLDVTQNFATSADGTAVPYFVVRRAGAPAGPTLLYGYGGFEISLTPSYSGINGRAWLARGGTYVVANIRGGGEYGPAWHTQVLRAGRHKVHEDFAAVARDLVARGVTTPEQLGAQGGSNGGLLMGIMVTRYPELFGAIVCQVPLLDMYRYPQLPAGASWIAEYGDPSDPDEWAFIREYSPYQNARADRTYPPILITTSTRDDRVHPGHARKMAARLQEQGHPTWYHENIEGGHGGAADNSQQAFKSALAYEFLWRHLSGGADN
ncbi:prolyl oligopeptidase family serine peptidase [Speluncibacter jeojiensis]|uniref:Prolyl oligopeptidase family serine peptidase n=1 Tax=Speluncibacter jeojiensis TaxID=2710754 RepID=A0A9X4M6U0_9ACTN|nr:prolyl oligopeptidase family serine peptidase [Corynebacteriales bacterium D3-21]